MASDLRSAATSGLLLDKEDLEFDRVYLYISDRPIQSRTFLSVTDEVGNRLLVRVNDTVCKGARSRRHRILIVWNCKVCRRMQRVSSCLYSTVVRGRRWLSLQQNHPSYSS